MKTCLLMLMLMLMSVLMASTSASPVVEETRHQQELREHYHHLSYIAEYSCHHPQPRTVPVHELLSPYQTRGKAYFPEYTVLHRCDMFAGCCEGAKKCGPIHADNVHLPFKVTYLEDMGDKHKGEWEMEYASFDNHTACGCIDRSGYFKPEVYYEKDHHKHEDRDHKDHHKHEDHDHKDHHSHEDRDHHKDHDHDHDHHSHGEHDKYPSYKEQYPPLIKESTRKDSYRPEEEYSSRPVKRPDSNKKIDSLYITI